MFRRKSYPDWAAVLAAFGLLLGAAAPWFALVLSIPPPAVQADAQVLTDEGGGPPSSQVRSGDGQPKLIALTFDDGPRRSTTTALLDGLAERGVKATFFLIGEQLENNEDVVRRMDEEGHQVGIHTFDHVKLTDLSRTDFDAQVETTRALLKSTLGHNDFLLRPPYGMLDESVKAWAGCPIILWSIDPEDWRDQNTDRVVREVVAGARDGGIILMHDIFPASRAAALEIVDALQARGYALVTLSTLAAIKGAAAEAGAVYSCFG